MSILYERFSNWMKETEILSAISKRGEEFTGIPQRIFSMALCGFLLIYLFKGYAPEFVCNILIFVCPAYFTIRSLENDKIDEHKNWLKYWIIFATLATLEFWLKNIISFFRIYWLLKIFFFMWCNSASNFYGSQYIYDYVILPLVIKTFAMDERPANYCTFFTLASFSRLLENASCKDSRKKLFYELESLLLTRASSEELDVLPENEITDDNSAKEEDDTENILDETVEEIAENPEMAYSLSPDDNYIVTNEIGDAISFETADAYDE